ncbi:MAG: alpha/beta hydrolase fold domain-containing protein [Phycisphaerales bacterium]|nr:MAG: alpha/beta hydrolase fold domain-containing protein [Phycisphaerales bacterium]
MNKNMLKSGLILSMLFFHFAAAAENSTSPAAKARSGTSPESRWIPRAGRSMEEHGWRLGTFRSRTVGGQVGYYYYLPPNYDADSSKRYPVIYWLHGLNGSPASANPIVDRLDKAIRGGTAPEMILISCTDPTKRSMWTDSKDGKVPVETVIVKELVEHVDSTFRAIAERRGRAIEGYSMGGYGAAFLGFKYPERFGVISILSGALHSPESLKESRGEIFGAVFGGDAEYAAANSPWSLVKANAGRIRGRTFVRIHVGERDRLKERNENLHKLLQELRIEHEWFVIGGSSHNPTEVFSNWPGSMFDFYAKAFANLETGTAGQTREGEKVEQYVYKKTTQGELVIHVHFPEGWRAGDKRPCAVFFFGGGWQGGRVQQFAPQAEYFCQRGMVTARADYRVRSRHGTSPDKCVEDGKSAVRWLRGRAAKLGIDPNHIVASGGSAGGHVAACTFTTKGLEAEGEDVSISSRPNLLVLFNPVMNCLPMAGRIGSEEMARRISPNHNLTADVPPTIVFFGTEDRFLAGGKEFIEKAAKLNIPAELYVAEGQRHGFFNRPPWLERTMYLADRFLARYGCVEGEPTVKLAEGRVEMKKLSPGE